MTGSATPPAERQEGSGARPRRPIRWWPAALILALAACYELPVE